MDGTLVRCFVAGPTRTPHIGRPNSVSLSLVRPSLHALARTLAMPAGQTIEFSVPSAIAPDVWAPREAQEKVHSARCCRTGSYCARRRAVRREVGGVRFESQVEVADSGPLSPRLAQLKVRGGPRWITKRIGHKQPRKATYLVSITITPTILGTQTSIWGRHKNAIGWNTLLVVLSPLFLGDTSREARTLPCCHLKGFWDATCTTSHAA